MLARSMGALLAGLLIAGPALAESVDTTPAKILFSQMNTPIPLEARSIGSYAKGCLAGAVALPVSGPDWQAMRLSRNRYWGTPELVAFTENLAAQSRRRSTNGRACSSAIWASRAAARRSPAMRAIRSGSMSTSG